MNKETLKKIILPLIVLVTVPDWFNIQFPAGNPLISTEPVAKIQVGAVIVPMTREVGVTGCILMVALAEAADVQPEALLTVKV